MTTDKLVGKIKRLRPYSELTQRHAIQLGRNFMFRDMTFLEYGIRLFLFPVLATLLVALFGLLVISTQPLHFAWIMLVAVWVGRKVEQALYVKMVSEGVDIYFDDYEFLLHGEPPISRRVSNLFN